MTDKELQKMAEVISQYEQNHLEGMVELADSLSCKEELQNVLWGNVRDAKQYGNVLVVQHNDYQWGVINTEGKVIVQFGKYGWIDGFEHGLARVRTHKHSGRVGNTIAIVNLDEPSVPVIEGKENIQSFIDDDRVKHPEKYAKWGIINEDGEEVLPVIYDNVWNFLGKERYSTKVELNGEYQDVYFHDLNPSLPIMGTEDYSESSDYDDYSGDVFSLDDCYDCEGNFDYDRLEDAILDGEYVPEDW